LQERELVSLRTEEKTWFQTGLFVTLPVYARSKVHASTATTFL
jgi:hypothetical protein